MYSILYAQKLAKAVHSAQDLVDGAGYLQPTPARRFLNIALPQSEMLGRIRTVPMSSHEEHVDKFRFATRVARAGTTEQALSEIELATPQLSKRVMRAVLCKASIKLPLETLEDNIEKEGYMQTVLDGFAARLGLDIEELLVNGDTNNAVDPYLALMDGFYKQADQILYNHAGNSVSLELWHRMIKLMPPEFQRTLSAGAFFSAFNLQHDWRANLAGRTGAVGDAMLQSLKEVAGFGIPIVPVYNVPDNKVYGGQANYSDVLLTHPANLVMGLYSGLRVFLDMDTDAGVWSVTMRWRMACSVVEQTACVKGTNVLSGQTSVRVGGSSTATLIPHDPAATSVLGFSETSNGIETYADGVTSYVPPADLGITAPALFTP